MWRLPLLAWTLSIPVPSKVPFVGNPTFWLLVWALNTAAEKIISNATSFKESVSGLRRSLAGTFSTLPRERRWQ
jgi:hypothetical protein